MSKFLGVASLWVCLISLPHVTEAPPDEAVASESSDAGVVPPPPPRATKRPHIPGNPFRVAALHASSEAPASPAAQQTARLQFKNDLDKTLTLVEAQFTMDGKTLPFVNDLKRGGEVILFTGPLAPGPHVIKARIACQGTQRAGVFTYMDKYRINAESEQVLTMPEDRSVIFTVIARRNKDMYVPFEKQLEITSQASELPDSGGARSLRN